jgi:hypothetical protein
MNFQGEKNYHPGATRPMPGKVYRTSHGLVVVDSAIGLSEVVDREIYKTRVRYPVAEDAATLWNEITHMQPLWVQPGDVIQNAGKTYRVFSISRDVAYVVLVVCQIGKQPGDFGVSMLLEVDIRDSFELVEESPPPRLQWGLISNSKKEI